jgi:catechol 2,3-dioxygenase-like lactoylglutathione lyase family enzyme
MPSPYAPAPDAPTLLSMPRSVHHVNLSVPEDGARVEGDWLIEMLGYREVDGGPDIIAMLEPMGRRVWWFEADDGHQVHLSPNPDHLVVSAAHTAVRLDDDLDPCIGRLEAAGFETRTIAFDGERHVFVTDPAGNLWELVGP